MLEALKPVHDVCNLTQVLLYSVLNLTLNRGETNETVWIILRRTVRSTITRDDAP